jgi:hypothetical protein
LLRFVSLVSGSIFSAWDHSLSKWYRSDLHDMQRLYPRFTNQDQTKLDL